MNELLQHCFSVGELIEILQHLGNEMGFDVPVIMSKDGEGNGYSPFSEASPALYLPETTWMGEIYNDEDSDDVDEDDQAPEDAVKAVILWPVN